MPRRSPKRSFHVPAYVRPQSVYALFTPHEWLVWIEATRPRLQQKMQRERAYLDRRAARGTHTPTDDAYEADQELETELVALLDFLKEQMQKEIYGH